MSQPRTYSGVSLHTTMLASGVYSFTQVNDLNGDTASSGRVWDIVANNTMSTSFSGTVIADKAQESST